MSYFSLDQKLEQSDGRPAGFDYLRLFLAASVVLSHSVGLSSGPAKSDAMWSSELGPLLTLILPMFFALSGFLVAGSLMRCATLGRFLGLRCIRIFPALAVEVVLSALVLGPLVTNLPLGQYFTDPLFANYFWNALGHPQYYLPGVFENNTGGSKVNGQLWTVPFELLCYIALAALALLGVRRFPALAPLGSVLFLLAFVTWKTRFFAEPLAPMPGRVSGAVLVSAFLAGLSFFLYRKIVPWNWLFGCASGALSIALLRTNYGEYLAVFPIAYLTVWLGLTTPKRVAMVSSSDYSYGIFLYGYAVQQSVTHFLPWATSWWQNAAISLVVVTMIAAVSWHWVESPAQRLKSPIARAEKWFLSHRRVLGAERPLASAKAD